jgi:hypothetical protein
VQVNVKHFLSGSNPIGNEEIDSIALHSTLPQCCCHSLTDTKNLSAFVFGEVSQVNGMSIWNHEQVTRSYRLNIHERRTKFVMMEGAYFNLTRDELADNTFITHWRLISLWPTTS